ncbi:MAG: hypothetical protein H6617_02480 [Bdellovibrionaceae bacterium]|nr:hypothetical protein [Bdellovibrionales bacterium]MCB9253529.1 hypothetical protein [Pseudobdellovibrionaceae bacterium]
MCSGSLYKLLLLLCLSTVPCSFGIQGHDGCGADTFDAGYPWTSPLRPEESNRFDSLRDFDWSSREPQSRKIDLGERVNDLFVEDLFWETTEALQGEKGLQLHWHRDAELSVLGFPQNWMVLGVPNRLSGVAHYLRPVADFAQFIAGILNSRIPRPRPLSNVHLLYLNTDEDQRLIDSPHTHNYEDYGVNIELLPGSKGMIVCGDNESESVASAQQLTVFNSRTRHWSFPQRRRLLMILSFSGEG